MRGSHTHLTSKVRSLTSSRWAYESPRYEGLVESIRLLDSRAIPSGMARLVGYAKVEQRSAPRRRAQ